ncbi:MAG: alpha-amylase family glycosyl hydrolase [Bacteroidota bacterium]
MKTLLLLSLSILTTLTLHAQWPNGVTYEIFVQSFYDTDGDSIGDFNGITEKLDYLADLGIEAIWLMPISPSPSYHKYDVTDYRDVHPDYGTMSDFKRMVEQAHRRNIKVVMDLVINHSSSEHPWFIESRKGPDNPYREYYVWRDYEEVKDEISKKTISLDSDNITQWHPNGDDAERYYGFFYGGMPDLNFDSEKLRKEIYDIGKFWLKDVGVDGFRLDAAKHIYPDDRAADSHAFWAEFRREMQSVKMDVYLVGEVWADVAHVAPFLEGLPALFNFDMWQAFERSLVHQHDSGLVALHASIQNNYKRINPDFIDATILSNHDQNRIMSVLKGDVGKAKVAAAMLLTLPGSPYIYYGEEIGMRGMKPDEEIREPFVWDEPGQDAGQARWITHRHNVPDSTRSLASQRREGSSLFQHYRRLIKTRKNSFALTLGKLEPYEQAVDGLVCFYRVHKREKVLVIHNVTDRAIDAPLPVSAFGEKGIQYVYPNKAYLNMPDLFREKVLPIAPYKSVVLKIQD